MIIELSWDDWWHIIAKSPKRTPRVKGVHIPNRILTTSEQQTIIDLIRASKGVIGVDVRLL
ncbi:hypothetical protein V1387_12790 [Allomuricauda taeanensis]|uniref:hypothetical protein n=1 Tax=Flagellimonas taeanensis TaxID=1005926 RepID=UPI002E7B2298|nr:hypothetical protein [Allomuricauda taeanensis]MEE1963567.1 hypothetical protein [Allomuricauda taeanensis]